MRTPRPQSRRGRRSGPQNTGGRGSIRRFHHPLSGTEIRRLKGIVESYNERLQILRDSASNAVTAYKEVLSEISRLKARIKKATGEQKQILEGQVEVLKKQRNGMTHRIEDMKRTDRRIVNEFEYARRLLQQHHESVRSK